MKTEDGVYRLGSRDFAVGGSGPDGRQSEAILSLDFRELACFRFEDQPRPASRESIEALGRLGIATGILSGDRAPVVAALASSLGISNWYAELSPREKVQVCAAAAEAGHKALVVGTA